MSARAGVFYPPGHRYLGRRLTRVIHSLYTRGASSHSLLSLFC